MRAVFSYGASVAGGDAAPPGRWDEGSWGQTLPGPGWVLCQDGAQGLDLLRGAAVPQDPKHRAGVSLEFCRHLVAGSLCMQSRDQGREGSLEALKKSQETCALCPAWAPILSSSLPASLLLPSGLFLGKCQRGSIV